jgi:tRNA-Thr(GGU) m(6)t(6)A37 methyltransferase TsaA
VEEIRYRPIGIIHSPFKEVKGMPIQPSGALGIKGTVELFREYSAGLKDIDGFSHIILIYHFHLSRGYALETRPFMEEETHGIFAMRAPARPNPIGISVVRLIGIEDNILHIEDVDIVDGTPLLDIKPYVPDFDWHEAERTGWLSTKSQHARKHKSDNRFMAEQ